MNIMNIKNIFVIIQSHIFECILKNGICLEKMNSDLDC